MNPTCKAKLMEEILPVVQKASPNLVDDLSYDTVMDFTYMGHCFYETMRIEPPIPIASPAIMSRDTTIQNISFKRKTMFFISIHSLHHDQTQW